MKNGKRRKQRNKNEQVCVDPRRVTAMTLPAVVLWRRRLAAIDICRPRPGCGMSLLLTGYRTKGQTDRRTDGHRTVTSSTLTAVGRFQLLADGLELTS